MVFLQLFGHAALQQVHVLWEEAIVITTGSVQTVLAVEQIIVYRISQYPEVAGPEAPIVAQV